MGLKLKANIQPGEKRIMLLGSCEFRISLQTALADIHAFVFFLFGDPNAHDGLKRKPDDQAGKKCPGKDADDPDNLT